MSKSGKDLLISKILGDAVSFEYSIAQANRRGWYKPFKNKEVWSKSVEFVEKHWREMLSSDIRLFVGNGEICGNELYDLVFALPELPTVDIIELAKTGTHNNPDDNWRDVKHTMQEIFNKCPFEIQFADEAGLHCTFLKHPSLAQAKNFSDMIVGISPEVFEGINEHVEQAGYIVPKMKSMPEFPDEVAAMKIFMAKMGKFRLWWD